MHPKFAIQLIQNDPRLNTHSSGCRVQGNCLIEIRTVVYDQSPPHCLTTLRSPRTPRQDRDFFIGRDLYRRDNVFSRSGHHNTNRFDLIRRGVS